LMDLVVLGAKLLRGHLFLQRLCFRRCPVLVGTADV
jgi:hypothetical protein